MTFRVVPRSCYSSVTCSPIPRAKAHPETLEIPAGDPRSRNGWVYAPARSSHIPFYDLSPTRCGTVSRDRCWTIPRLRELNISVEVGPWEVADLAPYVGHFHARLPHMRAAGLLKFSPIFKGP
jgi:hypothetical protein